MLLPTSAGVVVPKSASPLAFEFEKWCNRRRLGSSFKTLSP
jgi:hypothetical protein